MLLVSLALVAHAGALSDHLQQLEPLRAERLATTAPRLDASAYDRAEQGDIPTGITHEEGVAAAKAWGVGIWDVPVRAAWMAINDQERHVGRTGVTLSRILEGTPRHTGRLLVQLMPLPILSDRWWMVRQTHNAALFQASGGQLWELSCTDATDASRAHAFPEVAAALDTGIPVAWTHSAWLLVALPDGRTLAEYFAWTHPGGRVPVGPATRFAGGAVRKTIRGMGELAAEYVAHDGSGFVAPDQGPLGGP